MTANSPAPGERCKHGRCQQPIEPCPNLEGQGYCAASAACTGWRHSATGLHFCEPTPDKPWEQTVAERVGAGRTDDEREAAVIHAAELVVLNASGAKPRHSCSPRTGGCADNRIPCGLDALRSALCALYGVSDEHTLIQLIISGQEQRAEGKH